MSCQFVVEFLPQLAAVFSVMELKGLNLKALLSVTGCFKLFELVSFTGNDLTILVNKSLQLMVVVTFLLAYVGYDGDVPYLGPELDHVVLAEGLLVSWLVILTSTILGLVLGDGTAWKTVREAEHSKTLEVLSDTETRPH